MTEATLADYTLRLKNLRAELTKLGCDGMIVPMADEYQSEYVPPSAQRIAFLSGFTGSAGLVVVLRDQAAFFTDGRYTLQAGQQVASELYNLIDNTVISPTEWLERTVKRGQKIGYDPWLHTYDGVERLKKTAVKIGAELIPLAQNPVDAIWHNRPAAPAGLVNAYQLAYAGKTSAEKRNTIAAELKKSNLCAAIITDCASIAWLLNIRGHDVANSPLPLSFAILYANGKVKWFVAPAKVTAGLDKILGDDVAITHLDQFPHALDQLGGEPQPVLIDGSITASWIVERLRKAQAKLEFGQDPCALPKACKNSVEIEGMRAAHRRDGVALVKFFCWLDAQYASGAVTELSAEEKLAEFRKENALYRGPSFDTIAAIGGHGAIVHYRATPASNRKLETGQLFLLDSGGQYFDGTTDVTRTVFLGDTPPDEIRQHFTLVLKGHIALAAIRFPEGTTGAELDALARQFLWAHGLDYNHGTGHGVGCYLGVHEGPQGISKRNTVPLKPGMVLSNEPGYYKAGVYGIRIENLQYVTQIAALATSERPMLGFETLTMAPIDRRLIDTSMLTEPERIWLNTYHARVRDTLTPLVDAATAQWLSKATTAI